MGTISFVDLGAETMLEPVNSHRVNEGQFAVVEYTPEIPFVVTYGLYVCTAIVIANSERQRGLVAHLSVTRNLPLSLGALVDAYGEDVRESSVTIVRTNDAPDRIVQWPKLSPIVDYFSGLNPGQLTVDDNPLDHGIRGIALDLSDGEVRELTGLNGRTKWSWSKLQDTSLNQPIPRE